MRILHLSSAPSPPDAAVASARAARVVGALRDLGHEVETFVPETPHAPSPDPLAAAWSARREAQSWLAGRRADAVVFSGLWEGVAALAWAREFEARTIWDVGGFPSIDLPLRAPQILRRPGRVEQLIAEERTLLERTHRLVAPSRTAAHSLLRAGVPADRVAVVPDVVDAELFRPVPPPAPKDGARRRGRTSRSGRSTSGSGRTRTGSTGSGRGRGALRMVCRADLLSSPSLVPLFQAIASLAPRRRPDLLVVASARPGWRTQFNSLARRLGVQDSVHVTTVRDAPRLVSLLNTVDACVAPFPEGQAGTFPARCPPEVLEAMAIGLPIVSTRVALVQELVEHGVSAHLVEPGSATALADGLAWIAGHPYERAALGARARATVLAEYTSVRFRERLSAAIGTSAVVASATVSAQGT